MIERKKLEELVSKNMPTYDIAKELNYSTTNIRYWLKKYDLKTDSNYNKPETDEEIYKRCLELVSKNIDIYNYLFGLYLGDGCVNKRKNKNNLYSLSIAQDIKYTNLIELNKKSFECFFNTKVQIIKRKNENCACIVVYSNTIKFLFPKYGEGNKHLNNVYLTKILLENINYIELCKGLFHSDGSYYYDKHNKKYFYNFTNKSKDIIDIFILCLNKLEIGYDINKKKNNTYQLSIRKKDNVNKFYNLIGIK